MRGDRVRHPLDDAGAKLEYSRPSLVGLFDDVFDRLSRGSRARPGLGRPDVDGLDLRPRLESGVEKSRPLDDEAAFGLTDAASCDKPA